MRIIVDGRVFEGTPRQIVQSMRDGSMAPPELDLAGYARWIAGRADPPLELGEAAGEVEVCAALVRAMLRAELATRAGSAPDRAQAAPGEAIEGSDEAEQGPPRPARPGAF